MHFAYMQLILHVASAAILLIAPGSGVGGHHFTAHLLTLAPLVHFVLVPKILSSRESAFLLVRCLLRDWLKKEIPTNSS